MLVVNRGRAEDSRGGSVGHEWTPVQPNNRRVSRGADHTATDSHTVPLLLLLRSSSLLEADSKTEARKKKKKTAQENNTRSVMEEKI